MASITFDEVTQKMGGLAPTDSPIPGQSLTDSPDNRAAFEKPPKTSNQEEAVREIYMNLTNPDKIDEVLDTLRMGTPVEDVAQVILFAGFRAGVYTPDLMLALIEPTIYLIMAVAEAAGIDADLYPEEDFWTDDEEAASAMEQDASAFEGVMGRKDLNKPVAQAAPAATSLAQLERPAGISQSMIDKIKTLPSGEGA